MSNTQTNGGNEAEAADIFWLGSRVLAGLDHLNAPTWESLVRAMDTEADTDPLLVRSGLLVAAARERSREPGDDPVAELYRRFEAAEQGEG